MPCAEFPPTLLSFRDKITPLLHVSREMKHGQLLFFLPVTTLSFIKTPLQLDLLGRPYEQRPLAQNGFLQRPPLPSNLKPFFFIGFVFFQTDGDLLTETSPFYESLPFWLPLQSAGPLDRSGATHQADVMVVFRGRPLLSARRWTSSWRHELVKIPSTFSPFVEGEKRIPFRAPSPLLRCPWYQAPAFQRPVRPRWLRGNVRPPFASV